jgi:Protein of unknown function (DUF2585)
MANIERRHWLFAFAIIIVTIGILVAMDRPLICTCGYVKIWEGQVNGPGNSQHIADWYTPSHITHGMLFFGIGYLLVRRHALGWRMVGAVALEMIWEIIENSPFIINRYREATLAVGYSGDSILNSVADGGWMLAGFLIASRLPWYATVAIILLFELFTLFMIRDNLTLNIVMLLAPIDAIKIWQGGG